MKKNRSLLILAFLAVFALMFGSPTNASAASGPVELKFAHHNPPNGRTTVKFLDPWMKKVEEASKGKIKITSYPAQSLAKANEMLQAVEGGVADIAWVPLDTYSGRFPLTTVMTLPFIGLSSAEKNSQVFQKLVENIPELQKEFSSVKLLYVHTSDPYKMMTGKKAVKTMDDLKGMKIRVLGAIPADACKKLGAAPIFMPMPDIYEAAEKGVIDGAALPWAAVSTWRFYEVFNYWTDVNTWLATFMVFMNKDVWDDLPKDVQDGIMSVSGDYGAGFAGKSGWGPDIYDGIQEKIAGSKVKFERMELDEGQLAQWKEIAGKPIWEAWAKDMEAKGLPGRKVLDETLKLMETYK